MNIRDFMKDNFIILDGGMGTLLQEAGLKPGELPERWNVTHPEEIVRIQRNYFDAGSNVVLANTFGANGLKFDDDELEKLIRAAIGNAVKAKEESSGTQEKFVALDIGPLGKLLKPYGDYEFEDAVAMYAKTVRFGVKAGADLIFIETMNDSLDTKAALLAAKENSGLPVFVSNAYGSDGKLMTGASPAAMVAMLEGMHADAVGANCSLGPEQLTDVIEEYLKYASVPVLLKPNAGLPRSENGKTVYDVMPAEFGEAVGKLLKKGVRLAGGCCGTTPEFIKEVRAEAGRLTPVPVTPKNLSVVSSYTHAVVFGEKPVLIGERINPTGKKRFQQALRENDIDYILGEGLKQQDAGVDILDVNVGLPEIDEPKMLESVTKELQAVSDESRSRLFKSHRLSIHLLKESAGIFYDFRRGAVRTADLEIRDHVRRIERMSNKYLIRVLSGSFRQHVRNYRGAYRTDGLKMRTILFQIAEHFVFGVSSLENGLEDDLRVLHPAVIENIGQIALAYLCLSFIDDALLYHLSVEPIYYRAASVD